MYILVICQVNTEQISTILQEYFHPNNHGDTNIPDKSQHCDVYITNILQKYYKNTHRMVHTYTSNVTDILQSYT